MVDRERELAELFARLDDLCERARDGELAVSHFLTEAEIARADGYLKKCGLGYFFFGGYALAERKRAYILPDYIESREGAGASELLAEYGFSTNINTLLARGSGYERLSHRDFLGALLGLGLERSVIGDIVLTSESSAIVFCDRQIAGFICSELVGVARDKVITEETELDESQLPKRKFASLTEPIASTRLDCIVSALCSVSRERASGLIVGGLVEIDFEKEEKPDRKIELPCVMSVRGFGKYKLLCADTRTKKGRYRLEAQKYL